MVRVSVIQFSFTLFYNLHDISTSATMSVGIQFESQLFASPFACNADDEIRGFSNNILKESYVTAFMKINPSACRFTIMKANFHLSSFLHHAFTATRPPSSTKL
jgi:hypothetical protein